MKKTVKIAFSILFALALLLVSLSACGRGAKEVEPEAETPEVADRVDVDTPAPAVKAEGEVKPSPVKSPAPVESSAPSVSAPSSPAQTPSTPSTPTQGTTQQSPAPSTGTTPSTSQDNSSKPSTPSASTQNPSTPSHTHNWVASTTTVHHDEVGYYKTRVIKEAWQEQLPATYEYYCKCGYSTYSESEMGAHQYAYSLGWDEFTNHNSGGQRIHPGQIIYHEAETENVWVVDKPAYDETVTSYTCSCGAKK